MLKLKRYPYRLLLLTAILLFIVGFIDLGTISYIHLYDTFIITSISYLIWLAAIASLVLWSLYLVVKRHLYSPLLTWSHVILTTILLILFSIFQFLFGEMLNGLTDTPRRYYDYQSFSFYSFENYTRLLSTIILITLSSQSLFVINIVGGFLKRGRQQNNRSSKLPVS